MVVGPLLNTDFRDFL